MLAQLKLILQSDQKLNWRKASNLQGVLFEHLDPVFAVKMHEQSLHPYSQYFLSKNDQAAWYINTLNDSTYREMILPLLDPVFTSFEFHDHTKVNIISKELKTVQDKELVDEFNHAEDKGRFFIEFLTPTSFKRNGVYVILPDPRLMIQNLMMRYSASSPDISMTDEETLEEIASRTIITRYNLHSVSFPIESAFTPGFVGSVELHVKGNATMARYLQMLLHFGEFSGVGVKTGMGMGAIRYRRGEKA